MNLKFETTLDFGQLNACQLQIRFKPNRKMTMHAINEALLSFKTEIASEIVIVNVDDDQSPAQVCVQIEFMPYKQMMYNLKTFYRIMDIESNKLDRNEQ